MNNAPQNYAEIEIETAAHAGHEAVRIYCARRGDLRHGDWGHMTEEQKMPARHGAIGIIVEDHNAERSHEAWRAARAALGWRFGQSHNAAIKEHPCMVPWADLPFEEQAKNHLFVETVRAMAKALRSVANQ